MVDGGLYEATVLSRDDVEIIKTDYIPYVLNYASKEYGNKIHLIDIVSLDHLAAYLTKYADWLNDRATFCLNELS